MSAIDFVVRDLAGKIQRGSVSGQVGSSVIVGSGDDVSLNLDPSMVMSYGRQGRALEIVLVDGRVVVVEGFFSPGGAAENELFLSANGEMVRADLMSLDNGVLYADYVPQDPFGKWSPDDALFFVGEPEVQLAGYQEVVSSGDDVEAGMFAAPILGGIAGVGAGLGAGTLATGAAVVGGAVVVDKLTGGSTTTTTTTGGGGSASSNTQEVKITAGTESQNHVVNGSDYQDGVTISGTGTSGAIIEVTVGGKTETTTVGGDGKWSVVFDPQDVQSGTYETGVTVKSTLNGETITTTDTLVVDTQTSVTIGSTSGGADNILNAAEANGGLKLSGAAEAGSTVMVTVGGVAYEATVTGSTWTLSLPATAVQSGEYDLAVSVHSTDNHGNTAEASSVVRVDTTTFVTINTSAIGGNGILNNAEWQNGFNVGGTAQPYATVDVTFGGVTHTVTANASGNWNSSFSKTEIPSGTYNGTVSAVARDAAGNTASTSGTFVVDTVVDDYAFQTTPVAGDGVVSGAELSGGMTLNGSVEPFSKVVVTFNGHTRTVTADGNGNWSASWTQSEIPTGEGTHAITAVATDPNGNIETLNSSVYVDTYVNKLTGAESVTSDDTVNANELASGVTVTGTVEPGSRVFVKYLGTEYEATVAPNGNWTLRFPNGTFASGDYTAQLDIRAVDAYGNERTSHQSFEVDTVAPDAPYIVSANFYQGKLGDIGIPDNDTSIRVYELDGHGGVDQLGVTAVDARFDTVQLQLDEMIPDGRQLVVTTQDDAGNMNATLMVFDQADSDLVNIDDSGLDQFEISAIDLQYATGSELTLDEADIDRLAGNIGKLVVHGDTDDEVTLVNAVKSGTTLIDNENYDIYTVGSDGVLIIDEDIRVTI